MIKITIEKTVSKTYTARENVVTKETPTSIKEYSEFKMAKEYAVVEVTKTETNRVTLLEQVIEVDADLDLAAVIVAINKLK